MNRFAVINSNNGEVVNAVLADDGWEPPEGHYILEHPRASVGWRVSDGQFVEPPSDLSLTEVPEENSPDDELRGAIRDASTLEELKSALLGSSSNSRAAVAGRPK